MRLKCRECDTEWEVNHPSDVTITTVNEHIAAYGHAPDIGTAKEMFEKMKGGKD